MKLKEILLATIIFVYLLASSSLPLKSAEPLVEVPPLPNNEILEAYTDNETLFAYQVLEYYKLAIMLHTQIKAMNLEPKTILRTPTFDEITSGEINTIKNYQRIAKALYEEVKAAPDDARHKMLQNYNDLKQKMNDTITSYIIKQGEITSELLEKFIEQLSYKSDSYVNNVKALADAINENCVNCQNILSANIYSSIAFSNQSDLLKNKLGLGVKFSFNAGKIAGFIPDFNIWYSYLSPKFYTETYNYVYPEYDIYYNSNQIDWNTNIHSIGIGVKIPVVKNKNIHHGLNLEAGYFWLDASAYNLSYIEKTTWNGANANIQYYVGVPSCAYPFEIFVEYNLLHSFNSNAVFNTGSWYSPIVDNGKTMMFISAGIRFNLFTSSF